MLLSALPTHLNRFLAFLLQLLLPEDLQFTSTSWWLAEVDATKMIVGVFECVGFVNHLFTSKSN